MTYITAILAYLVLVALALAFALLLFKCLAPNPGMSKSRKAHWVIPVLVAVPWLAFAAAYGLTTGYGPDLSHIVALLGRVS